MIALSLMVALLVYIIAARLAVRVVEIITKEHKKGVRNRFLRVVKRAV